MRKRTRDYTVGLYARLSDPQYAADYLNAALDESEDAFLGALRDVAEARQISTVARLAQLNREGLYRMLSEVGNPRLSSLVALLSALGLHVMVAPNEAEPIEAEHDVGHQRPGTVPSVIRYLESCTFQAGSAALQWFSGRSHLAGAWRGNDVVSQLYPVEDRREIPLSEQCETWAQLTTRPAFGYGTGTLTVPICDRRADSATELVLQ